MLLLKSGQSHKMLFPQRANLNISVWGSSPFLSKNVFIQKNAAHPFTRAAPPISILIG